MSNTTELPKAYDPSSCEDEISAAWEESGFFDPDHLPERNQNGEPYAIVMPPANRTGTLHLGHATMLAIEDLMIRFHRMRGKKTLWIPGTDHAAIATQVKVEQLLIKEGIKNPRRTLGREKFLERVVAFADESGKTIRKQIRKMGASCDWSRERYTLDEDRNRAVNAVFKMMYDDGLIERGFRLVNWDPQFQTTLSDDEVLMKETTARLVTFTYDKDFPIAISTTRPETKFGDTAVAVHPTDERYRALIGKVFHPVFCGKALTIKIVADESVDPAFGTGALGVTPAHSMIDEEIAQRHNLPMEQVIGEDGRMLPAAGKDFAGLKVKEAREQVEKMLTEQGLLKSVEEVAQNLPVAERGGGPVEQLPMKQWFIRVNKSFAVRQDTLGKWKKGEETTLKELMRYAVESGQIHFVPERFTQTYFQWIDHLRDWCISRQIWFGHKVPVWNKQETSNVKTQTSNKPQTLNEQITNTETIFIGDISPGKEWLQDPDTLDTWFSSALWTFSALGWPDKKTWGEYRAYHPTAVLETGYDILFFWVARMVLMSAYVIGEVPFHDVYLHGLVRDERGKKMSKSLGNALDPLDLIPKYGTDAVRLSLLIGTTPGQDVKLSERKIEGYRNFANKLWNVARYILSEKTFNGETSNVKTQTTNKTQITNYKSQKSERTIADRWILARMSETTVSVTKKLEAYQFSSAGEELRDFTWGDLADWYLEIAKVEGEKGELLMRLLKQTLILWHPFMPFVTERIWQLAGFEGMLIVEEWPEMQEDFQGTEMFDLLRSVVTDARRLRTEQGYAVAMPATIFLKGDDEFLKTAETELAWMERLAGAKVKMEIVAELMEELETMVGNGYILGIEKSNVKTQTSNKSQISKDQEIKKEKEQEELRTYIESLRQKLSNKEFLEKAPAKVVEEMKRKMEEAGEKLLRH